ncbi:MAG TPA: hypothetical protein VK469_05120, partial [Candidatus Kapabacteria bacterium]|nr:hypothetical protein [Candidatus Kapabacteria bacterium]
GLTVGHVRNLPVIFEVCFPGQLLDQGDQLIYDFGSDNSYGVREATGWFEQVEHWANILNKKNYK